MQWQINGADEVITFAEWFQKHKESTRREVNDHIADAFVYGVANGVVTYGTKKTQPNGQVQREGLRIVGRPGLAGAVRPNGRRW